MDTSSTSDDLYPIAVLIDELKHEDVTLRLNAIRRLSTIALALGPERTRAELIPFLEDSLEDEDEVLTVLAEELGKFVPYVGGNEYAYVLIPPLESFAAIEELLVREKATESLILICSKMTDDQVEQYYMPLIKRLSSGNWFTSKVSVTAICPSVYEKVGEESKKELLQIYRQLVTNEAPMVRRAAATHLTELTGKADREIVGTDIRPMFSYFTSDEQDSVRLLTIDVFIAIAKVLGPQNVRETSLASLEKLFADKSWRVRYMIADRFETLAEVVAGEDETVLKEVFVPTLIRYLKDHEAEVRTVIAKQISGFCKQIDAATIIEELMPGIEDLVNDQSQHVRAALAMHISGLAPLLGKEDTIKYLLPMFLQMLKDEFPDVRLNIICNLEQVHKVIGIDLLSQSLLPAITQLAQDKQWRVRLAIIEYIPLLASQLGVEFFDTQLRDLCMDWLHDNVYSIREAATKNLRNLTKVFGVEWARETIMPKVIEAGENPNYLYRMTSIAAATTLADEVTIAVIKDEIVPFLEGMVGDPIPNIRFTIARSYETIAKMLKEKETGAEVEAEAEGEGKGEAEAKGEVEGEGEEKAAGEAVITTMLIPSLERLKEDEDVDVRFYAEKSLAAIG
ncbi:armadillo-type protein [Lipomyces oligophaga]|uniref:armadillo-type protein n=1 Tax=Lipomyces oligophaga TaxID=45792 RepID=UPI0034CDD124